MGMFTTYENLGDNYVPNNMCNCFDSRGCRTVNNECFMHRPYESLNEHGEVIGYWWYYGDTVTLQFDITGTITIADSAILYSTQGQTPNTSTVGLIGQKIYNIIDYKSWTCTAIDEDKYIWTEDTEFSPLEAGQRNVYLDIASFMSDKEVQVQFFDFRGREIVEARKTFPGSTSIIYNIDKELSELLVKSTYTCKVTVSKKDDLNATILDMQECMLTVV